MHPQSRVTPAPARAAAVNIIKNIEEVSLPIKHHQSLPLCLPPQTFFEAAFKASMGRRAICVDRCGSRNLGQTVGPASRLPRLSWALLASRGSFCPLSTTHTTSTRRVIPLHTSVQDQRRHEARRDAGGGVRETVLDPCPGSCPSMITRAALALSCLDHTCTACERAWHTPAKHTRTSYTYDGTA